jgi:hypothetical protein
VSDNRDDAPTLASAVVRAPVAPASPTPTPAPVVATPPARPPSATAEAATDRPAVPPAKKGNGALIGIAAVVVLVAGAGVFWFSSHRSAEPVEQPASATAANNAAVPETPSAPPVSTTPADSAPQTSEEAAPAPSAPAPAQAARPAPPVAPTAPARGGAAPVSQAAPAVEDTARSFNDARVMVLKGRKADDQQVTLWFANGYINAIAAKGQESLGAMSYKAVAGATYLRARDPKWNADLASPPDNLDVGGMLRTDKNWLVIQSREAFLIFRLDDADVRTVLQTLTEKTGVTVDYPKK